MEDSAKGQPQAQGQADDGTWQSRRIMWEALLHPKDKEDLTVSKAKAGTKLWA